MENVLILMGETFIVRYAIYYIAIFVKLKRYGWASNGLHLYIVIDEVSISISI